jgi:potassium channel subfamily K, other eukaryote
VTVLTVGYGDLYPVTNLGRALLIPFSFGGILSLGLVISSIFKSIKDLGEQNVIRHHYEKIREKNLGRAAATSLELERKEIEKELARERALAKAASRASARSPQTMNQRQNTFESFQFRQSLSRTGTMNSSRPQSVKSGLTRTGSFTSALKKKDHILLLREEKDRFNEMRNVQKKSEVWKRWVRLSISISVFGIFWCVGAVVFWQLEKDTLDMTYWESVYYCWVTLITIGYGDFSPHSVAGRSFFVVWVQFAVPALTVLAENLSLTVVEVVDSFSNDIFTWILPRQETLQTLQYKLPLLFRRLPQWIQKRLVDPNMDPRILHGFDIDVAPGEDEKLSKDDAFAAGEITPDIAALEEQHRRDLKKAPDAAALARQLALAIKRCALDMHTDKPKAYAYEEWVEFTRLIRFTAIGGPAEAAKEEQSEGMVQWDWLGDTSPLMSEQQEAEFVLDRLCESLVRYLRRNPPNAQFAETLKLKGEEHLRMKSGGWNGEEEEAHAQETQEGIEPIPWNMQAKQDTEKAVGGSSFVGGSSLVERMMDFRLHPVNEDDQEIRPVRDN